MQQSAAAADKHATWRWGWGAALAVYAGLLALHAPLLRLPYYWDEAGYYIFAALDCYHHGLLIPHATQPNGHPPLLSLYLSAAWLLAGFHPWVTRAAMLGWGAALVCGVYALAAPRLGHRAALPALLVGLSPLVFAQSSLAQLDLPVAALVLWALVVRQRGDGWQEAGLLTAACLMKETAVIVPAVLLLWDLAPGTACLCRGLRRPRPAVTAQGESRRLPLVGAPRPLRDRPSGPTGQCLSPAAEWDLVGNPIPRPRSRLRGVDSAVTAYSKNLASLKLLLPIAVLGGWFLFYHAHTGYWLGNPQFFAYNVGQAAASLPRILLALLRRIWQLAFYDGTGFLTAAALLAVWRARRLRAKAACGPSPIPVAWLLVMGIYLVFHAIIGGAVLARYLLPALALYYIVAAEWLLRLPRAAWWVAACGVVLVASWFWNPPYPFPYEDNLAYVQFVQLQQAAAQALAAQPPSGATVTAWPASDELTRPALGYVPHPLPVYSIPDFSASSLAGIHFDPAAVLLYSRVYQPSWNVAADTPFWSRWARRYFGFQPPVPAGVWLRRLHLHATFQRQAAGQWVLLAEH